VPKSRYFYHSFPRDGGTDVSARALAILESVLNRGLLLTPERIEFREELSNGTLSEPWYVMQKRLCFTELEPRELPQHASTFGPFSFEWDIATLIEMGAVPVFYVPLRSTTGANDGVACSMLARLGEIQQLLVRLEGLDTLVRQTPNHKDLLNITRDDVPEVQTRCTVGGAHDLLQMLQTGMQPISALTSSLRALSGYFYPTDHPKYTDLLGYYRQREWKLLANIIHRGVPVTVPVNEQDIEALIRIDGEFFEREVDFPSGRKKRVRECQLYKTFREAPIAHTVRKFICPQNSMTEVQRLFDARNVRLEIVAIEGYAAA